jgi:amino acid adenylation domain-containing protein
VVDGVTFYTVFVPELARLYTAYTRGTTPQLPPLVVQYGDYARWRQQPSAFPQDRLTYWAERLSGDLPPLELPADRPRPARPTHGGGRVQSTLSADFRSRVAATAAASGTTPFVVLLSIFLAQLHKLTGQTDLIVGVPIAASKPSTCEGLIGLFANIVALRVDVSCNPSFGTLVRRVRDAVLDASDHADVPLQQVVERVRPARNAAQTPLFNAMFALQHAAPPGVAASGFSVVPLAADTRAAKVDIALLLDARDGNGGPADGTGVFGATLQYATDLFDSATIARRLNEFEVLASSAMADPTRRLADLSLMTADQHDTIVDEWNRTSRPCSRDVPVHQIFEAQAARTPDAPAVAGPTGRLTFRELDARANRLAAMLQHHGAGRGTRVAVLLERSTEFVVAALATLKAGASYVPLDPAAPAQRLSFMLEDAGIQVVVTALGVDGSALGQIDIIRIDANGPALGGEPVHPQPVGVTGDDLACVLYTSGSTGQPKGVAVAHKGLARLVVNTDYVALGPGDRVAHLSNVCFDAASFEIWGALTSGAELVIVRADDVLSPRALAAAIAGSHITTMFLTTALFNLLAVERPSAFGGVRDVLFGGESADPEAVRRVLDSGNPPERLINVYGPTETTTFASWHRVDRSDVQHGAIPIGRPIANTTLYVLDRTLRPAPVGVPGELFIGGDGVASGYVNRPDLTAERFVPDPFGPAAGARLYRTGDVVRYRTDGVIEFVGRVDNQIKIRGFRIEPGEIECAVGRHPDVTACVVVARTTAAGEKQLIAYVGTAADAGAAQALPLTVRAFLKGTLPDYLLPSAVVVVSEWPLTATGKIDRRALPAPPAAARVVQTRTASEPWETELVSIWEELLGVRPIGIHDSFFDLGGHSLLAARMADAVEKRTGMRLPLAALFVEPTVAATARALTPPTERSSDRVVIAVHARGSRTPIFFLHGDFTGGGFFCRRLASRTADHPFYAVQPHGMDGRPIPRTVNAMAEELVAAIRHQRPHGPYVLGGYCNGAIVAVEIARQLSAAGEQVEHVILVDPPPVADRPFRMVKKVASDWLGADEVIVGNWYCRVRDFLGLPPRRKLALLRRRISAVLPGAAGAAFGASTPYEPSGDYWLAIRTYVPSEPKGPVTVIASEAQMAVVGRSWTTAAGSVNLTPTPGDHTTCITTHAETLANRFSEALAGSVIRQEVTS